MKQIDQPPEGYRTQNRSGRWVENVDRNLARWMAAGGTVFMLYFAWHYRGEMSPWPPLAFLGMGIAIGANIMLSIWPRGR